MVFFALLCYNDLSKNRKVDAKMDYQKWAQEVAQKIKIKELEVAKRNRGKIPYTAENGGMIALVKKSAGGQMASGAA